MLLFQIFWGLNKMIQLIILVLVLSHPHFQLQDYLIMALIWVLADIASNIKDVTKSIKDKEKDK